MSSRRKQSARSAALANIKDMTSPFAAVVRAAKRKCADSSESAREASSSLTPVKSPAKRQCGQDKQANGGGLDIFKHRGRIDWADICDDDNDDTLWDLIGTMAGERKLPENEELFPDEDTLTATPTKKTKTPRQTPAHSPAKAKSPVRAESPKFKLVDGGRDKDATPTKHRGGRDSDTTPVKRRDHRSAAAAPSAGRATPEDRELDKSVIARRQKQVDYGKNTIGYQNYVAMVPKAKRAKNDPRTPDKFAKYSRRSVHDTDGGRHHECVLAWTNLVVFVCRSWDMQIKKWRQALHQYDDDADSFVSLASELDFSASELSDFIDGTSPLPSSRKTST